MNLFKVKKCDVVISIVPFTTSVLLGYLHKKRFKAKLWTHIQDFEFDAALQTGFKMNKLATWDNEIWSARLHQRDGLHLTTSKEDKNT